MLWDNRSKRNKQISVFTATLGMAVGRCLVLLLLQLGYCKHSSANPLETDGNGNFATTILMPGVVATRADALVCTARKLGPEETYIVKFTPHASKSIAHHMMVYGCEMPGSNRPSWECENVQGSVNTTDSVCGGRDSQILFAWALDAPEKSLPEGVGIRVSGSTNINYMVVQLHYAKPFAPGVTDNSGITIGMTYNRPPQQVGYLVLGNWGYIPPQVADFHMDTSCEFPLNYTIYPIGYRTHSHNLGFVTSGYRIRDGKWLQIGKMSPQRPQAFYGVNNPGIDIRHGDVLAGRCVMNSKSRSEVTIIGATNHDEMCNFYIMYSTYEQKNLKTTFCFTDANNYNWLQSFKPEDIPKDSESIDGIPGAQEVIEKFKSAEITI